MHRTGSPEGGKCTRSGKISRGGGIGDSEQGVTEGSEMDGDRC